MVRAGSGATRALKRICERKISGRLEKIRPRARQRPVSRQHTRSLAIVLSSSLARTRQCSAYFAAFLEREFQPKRLRVGIDRKTHKREHGRLRALSVSSAVTVIVQVEGELRY